MVYVQNILSHTEKYIINNSGYTILKSIINVLSLFIVQSEYKDDDVTSVRIQCTNCNKYFHCQIPKIVAKDVIPVFIKVVVFHHVGISRIIQTKEKI